MSRFDFLTAGRIAFGRGRASEAAAAIAGFGRRVLLVRGRSVDWVDALERDLAAAGCEVVAIHTRSEPDLADVEACVGAGRGLGAEVVVAAGGGSAIDLGKAAAALIPGRRPALAHLEVVGEGRPLDAPPLPFVAIPTTAGTGAEATRNAVILVPDRSRKVSLRDDRMLPRLAIVDPALTDGCGRAVTLASGLDAVTQVIEPYLSSRANPLTDALCRDAIPRGLGALARLMEREDREARDGMAFTSLVGGIALANAGLGAVHGLAGVIGGLSRAPHGALCGRLLPAVLRANREAFGQRGGDTRRFAEVEGWIRASLGGGGDGFDLLEVRIDGWGLPRLGNLNVPPQLFGRIAADAKDSSSMRGNIVPLPETALVGVLTSS